MGKLPGEPVTPFNYALRSLIIFHVWDIYVMLEVVKFEEKTH